jgi:hypothetical protein
MAFDYHRLSGRSSERKTTVDRDSKLGIAIGTMAILAVVAMLLYMLFEPPPSGPSVATSKPTVTTSTPATPTQTPPAQ